jgi:hypothetical protein
MYFDISFPIWPIGSMYRPKQDVNSFCDSRYRRRRSFRLSYVPLSRFARYAGRHQQPEMEQQQLVPVCGSGDYRKVSDAKCSNARAAAREPSSGNGRSSFQTVAVRNLLLLFTLLMTSCASAGLPGAPLDRFEIVTEEGTVLAIVKGSATGFANSDLTRLIRKGVAETYSIKCDLPSDLAATNRRMFWHVNNYVRKPIAIISVDVVQGHEIINRAYTSVAAPGSNPDAVFMSDVSRLARRVLPATKPNPSRSSGCG